MNLFKYACVLNETLLGYKKNHVKTIIYHHALE